MSIDNCLKIFDEKQEKMSAYDAYRKNGAANNDPD
jgi:hypothetical protein